MKRSNLFNLNKHDLVNGLVLAVIIAVLTSSLELISALKTWPTRAEFIGMLFTIFKVTLITLVGYFIKKLLQNDEGKFLQKNEDSKPN